MPADDDAPNLSGPPETSEAARWAARRMNRRGWTARDEAEYQTWLAAAPERAAEMAEYDATLKLLDQAEAFPPGEIERVLNRSESRRTRRRWFIGLAAAAVVMIVCVSLRLYIGASEVISTGIAERREAVLSDGTRVRLDAGTTLEARIGWWQRTVEMTAGEAVFEVALDQRRAFAVRAGGCEIRDIGTIFSVKVLAPAASPMSGAEVAVQEGAVEMCSTTDESAGVVRLVMGESATWDGRTAPPRAQAFDRARFASWRDGRRHYEDSPLRQIVADLQRYTRERIEVRDASLAEMPVTGTLSMGRPAEAFEVLRAILPLRIIREPGRIILALEAGGEVTPSSRRR